MGYELVVVGVVVGIEECDIRSANRAHTNGRFRLPNPKVPCIRAELPRPLRYPSP
jgi:hypothetical protein